MMLYNFYNSKQWKKTREQFLLEKTIEEGALICEECGKVINNKYGAVIHHKEYLTEENVNDINITCNKNNLELLCMKCHNKIHNKGFVKIPKKIYLVYGAPLSGKKTYVKETAEENDLILDIDNIYEMITNNKRYCKPDDIKYTVFNIKDYIMELIRTRKGKWHNAYIIGGYPSEFERRTITEEFDIDYLIYIDTTKEECIKRLKEDKNGRDIEEWSGYINKWFEEYTE